MGSATVGIQQPHAAKQFQSAPDEVQENLKKQRPILEGNPQVGTYISLNQVYNKDSLKKWSRRLGHEVQNLYKLDLPGAWRALYTVRSEVATGETLVLLIEIVDHKEYERLLGY